MKKIYLLLLLCCLSFTNFATIYYSNPAGGDPSVLTSWSDNPAGGGATPFTFTNTTDSFVVQSQMLMTAAHWTVYSPVCMIGTSSIANNRTGGGGGGGGGGALITELDFFGNLTMNDNSSITTTAGSGGGGFGGGSNLEVDVNLYANFFMTGNSFFENLSDQGENEVAFLNTTSSAVTPQLTSATGTSNTLSEWTNWFVDQGVFVQLSGNFSTEPPSGGGGGFGGGSPYPFEVGGSIDCENFSFTGAGSVTTDRASSFYTTNATGISGSLLTTGNSLSGAANYIFDGSTPQVTGVLLPTTITVQGGGGGGTSIGSVTINNPAGVSLSQSTTFATVTSGGFGGGSSTGSLLNLTSGSLTLGSSILTMGTASTITGTFSGSSMIITNGTGQLRKQFSTAGSFTYPIGDNAGNYTPISLAVTGTSFSTGGAYLAATVHNAAQPNNANVTDYLKRYWSLSEAGITGPSYTVTAAQYVPGDVVGTEANISAGKYPSALPWVKYSAANTATHTLSSAAITNPAVDFSGLATANPTITITPGSTVCAGSPTVLSVLSYTGDNPTFSWTPTSTVSPSTGTSVTATPTSITTYTATITDGNGFTAAATTTLATNPAPAPLTSSSGTGTLCIGQTLTLHDAVGGGTWSSTTTAASVDASGNVTAGSAGAALILYTVTGGCNVNFPVSIITAADPIVGSSAVCTGAVTSLFESGAGTWSSSNTALATVDAATGAVSGINPGNPTVTYTLAPGCIATTVITVNPVPAAIGGASSICSGATTPLTESTTGGVWSSSNTAIAVVSATGGVTGLAAGTPSIAYTIPTGCSTSIALPVVLPPPAITGAGSVCSGLTATLTDVQTGGTWISGNTALATVNPVTGLVHGISPGTPTISYFVIPGCATSIPLTVNPGGTPSVAIAVNPGETVCPGSTASFTTTSSAFAGTAPTYKWVKNGIYVATGPSYSFVPANGDVVYNVMHSNFACRSIDSASSSHITMSVTAGITPVVAITAVSTVAGKGQNDTLVANVTSATPTPHYQWYKGSTMISGATMSFYVINTTTTGIATYNCVVSNGEACNATGISNGITITVSDVSVKQMATSGNELKLAPNPSKGIFTMNLASDNNETVHVVITNLLGEKVKEFTATTNTDTEVNLNVAAGVYLLSANTDNARYVARVVVN